MFSPYEQCTESKCFFEKNCWLLNWNPLESSYGGSEHRSTVPLPRATYYSKKFFWTLVQVPTSSAVPLCYPEASLSINVDDLRFDEFTRSKAPSTVARRQQQFSLTKFLQKIFFWPSDDRLRREGEKTLPQNFIGLLVPGKNSRKNVILCISFLSFPLECFADPPTCPRSSPWRLLPEPTLSGSCGPTCCSSLLQCSGPRSGKNYQ